MWGRDLMDSKLHSTHKQIDDVENTQTNIERNKHTSPSVLSAHQQQPTGTRASQLHKLD